MVRLRIKYEKIGAIRFNSHRDTMRVFRRCFASADIPVSYSQGFNPHPRLSFGPSLRTGWESLGEYMDVVLAEPATDLIARCNPSLPEGLRVVEAAPLLDVVPKLSTDVTAVRMLVIVDDVNLQETNETWAHSVERERSNEPAATDGRDVQLHALEAGISGRFLGGCSGETAAGAEPNSLLEVHVDRNNGEVSIEYVSTMHQGKCLSPEEVLTPVIGDPQGFEIPIKVMRKDLYVRRSNDLHSPISKGVVENSI